MNSVIDILESLESDNSRLFKEDLLERNRKNDLLKRVFVSTFDPYVNYYVKKFKAPKALDKSVVADDRQVKTFLDVLLVDLASRNIVGNEAKLAVEAAFALMDSRQQKWCQRILLKNLRCGVQETTVNKVWPGTITKFSVQLAETLASRFEPGKGIVATDPIRYPIRVEPKLDGLRCIAVKHNGVVTMFTRSGSVLETPGIQEIKRALESSPWDNFVLDGELLDEDGTWNSTASGVLKKKI